MAGSARGPSTSLGAGPMSERKTFRDIMGELSLPRILVNKRLESLFTDRDIAADRGRYARQKAALETNLANVSGIRKVAVEYAIHDVNMKIAGLGR